MLSIKLKKKELEFNRIHVTISRKLYLHKTLQAAFLTL